MNGTAQLGELRRRQGRLDEARSLFTQSEASWGARIGSVELALDEGDAATAFALAERLERATEDGRRLDRVAVLTLLARTAVAAGRVERASEAAAELDALADSIGTGRVRAAAAHAGGESAFASGDLERARTQTRGRDRSARRLRDALRTGAGAARTRPRPLHARRREPRPRGGDRGARCLPRPRRSPRHGDRGASPRGSAPAARGTDPLTRRERQVLAFVAAGRSNREIAGELVVSQHTVHRHVANILRKLDEPTRAAAAAHAARNGLDLSGAGPIRPSLAQARRWPDLAKRRAGAQPRLRSDERQPEGARLCLSSRSS